MTAPATRRLLLLSAVAFSLARCTGDNQPADSEAGAGADADAGATDAGADAPEMCGVPSSFSWSSSGGLLGPRSDAVHNLTAIKDPSVRNLFAGQGVPLDAKGEADVDIGGTLGAPVPQAAGRPRPR